MKSGVGINKTFEKKREALQQRAGRQIRKLDELRAHLRLVIMSLWGY